MSDGCIRSVENLCYDSDDAKGSLTHTHTHTCAGTHTMITMREERDTDQIKTTL